ncbi:MAG: DUF4335 domain-containing protein [Xenococcaceae cyanobacterium MO_188.B19]|nr:DUF4335 domain-containing protein [Xenococcaceae cyanobacterium MO_188.B19]
MISSSHSVIHRLTPPTCTLEIWGKQSPLSKWSKKEIVKDIHFKLSFDAPTLLEEQKVSITGDRVQLEAIYEGVIIYVQKFLKQSFPIESFPNNTVTNASDNNSIYLKAKGLVNHELFIPNLENSPINLTTVQLFDLVTALEEYKTKIGALPGNTKSKKVIPLWFKGIAGLALAVGLSTAGIKLVQKQASESESIASVQESDTQNNQSKFDDVVPPEIPQTTTKINPEIKVTEPLSSAEKLPPPPAVDAPKPPPNIPDPAKYPIPEGNLVIPPPVRKPIATKPKSPEKSQTNSDSSQIESKIKVPQETEKKETIANNVEINLETANSRSQIAINSNDTPARSQESLNDDSLLAGKNNRDVGTSAYNQVKEVKAYFQQTWQPPKELKQTLEYRLIINANGSIKRIIPIGTVSEIFIDRTNIPLMGEKFVSPLKNQSQATVRLFLSPDGDVTTILE